MTSQLVRLLAGRRKTSTSTVVLRDSGCGRVTINGRDYLDYFPVLQDR